MHSRSDHLPLRIAVSFGVPCPPLASLLARQRAEEPQVPVRLHEVTLAEQLSGLEDGRYDGGLALTDAPGSSLSARPLWRDELALALPVRSPLLAFAEVPLEETAQYPLVRWCTQACEPVSRLVDTLLGQHASFSQAAYARSYDLMAVLVAAGYGIGLGAKSHLAASRKMDIVMRPLAGDRHPLTAYFLRSDSGTLAPVDRLVERAQAIQV